MMQNHKPESIWSQNHDMNEYNIILKWLNLGTSGSDPLQYCHNGNHEEAYKHVIELQYLIR